MKYFTIMLGLLDHSASVTLAFAGTLEEAEYVVGELVKPGTWAKIIPCQTDIKFLNSNFNPIKEL